MIKKVLITMVTVATVIQAEGAFNLGAFFENSWQKDATNMTDGTISDMTIIHFGLSLGGDFKLPTKDVMGFYGDLGVGQNSGNALISHLSGGIDYLFNINDKVSVGPSLGFGSSGFYLGGRFTYKSFFLRPQFGFWPNSNSDFAPKQTAIKITAGYSFGKRNWK